MERCTDSHFQKSSLRDEHYHRYRLAALIARGRIIDCACGIGYGGAILDEYGDIESYAGIDPSLEAIDFAMKNFKGGKLNYFVGTIEDNPLADIQADSYLMFETLEHTVNPDLSLKKARNQIARSGVLIGSVPSMEYEYSCEEAYSKNPYHLHKFSLDDLSFLLQGNFEFFRVFAAEFTIGTTFREIATVNSDDRSASRFNGELILGDDRGSVNGSFFFIAGSHDAVESSIERLGSTYKYLQGIPKVRLDLEEIVPIQVAFRNAEEMIRQRDEALASQASMLEQRWSLIRSMEDLIRQRDEAWQSQAKVIQEQEAKMESVSFLSKRLLQQIFWKAK